MSSFRIDRQYVAYEPAEVRAVRESGLSLDEGEEYSLDWDWRETAKQSREILKKARETADIKAQLIIEGAKTEAEAMLSKTRTTTAHMIKDAQDKSVDIRESAKREGYAQGYKEAEGSAAVRRAEEAAELQKMADELKAAYAGTLDSMRGDVISLVMEITKKIIGVKLQESDQVFMNIVTDALNRLKQAKTITIRVCPEDYERYFVGGTAQGLDLNTGVKAAVMEEAKYSSGDLVLESEGEVLDLSVFKQLEKVERAFLNGMDR